MEIELRGKTYKVRQLEFDDTFRLAEILEKIDFDITKFQGEFKDFDLNPEEMELSAKEKKGLSEEEIHERKMDKVIAAQTKAGRAVVMRIANDVLRNSPKAKKEFREFMGSLIGVKAEQMGHMPIDAPVKILKALAKEHDLMDFFKQAAG